MARFVSGFPSKQPKCVLENFWKALEPEEQFTEGLHDKSIQEQKMQPVQRVGNLLQLQPQCQSRAFLTQGTSLSKLSRGEQDLTINSE